MMPILLPVVLVSWLHEIKDSVELTLADLRITDAEVEQLRATAPTYLDNATARANLQAADVASSRFHIPRDLLLSIAWHESRYQADIVSRDPDGRVACGVMTPSPQAKCKPVSMLEGYLAGSEHLAEWFKATRTEREALLGYAGGWRMIKVCRAGKMLRHGDHGDNLCLTPEVFTSRARRISRASYRS
jgi:hypothetical protein